MGRNFILPKNTLFWFPLLLSCLLAGVAAVAAAGAAAFGGASGHPPDNGVSSSVAKAINCVAVSAYLLLVLLVLGLMVVAVESHISGPGQAGGMAGG